MDEPLRNRIWNALEVSLWTRVAYWNKVRGNPYGMMVLRFFGDYLARPIDEIDDRWNPETKRKLRSWFFGAQWYEVYDCVEFFSELLAAEDDDAGFRDFRDGLNQYLEEEQAAYRLIGSRISEITRSEEVSAIEKALDDSSPYVGVNEHLREALQKLTSRSRPDYRNSIKESISAVESICRHISGDKKATLGEALKKLDAKGVNLHPALKRAWLSLYGYTSDEEGVRHSLMEQDVITFADAKYMLVSCSAFVSYLIEVLSRGEG